MTEPSWALGIGVLLLVVVAGLWHVRSSLRISRVRRQRVGQTTEALQRSMDEVRHGDPAEAMRMLDVVIANASNPQALVQAYLMRGVMLSERGRHKLASEAFDKCLENARSGQFRFGVTSDAAAAVRRSYTYVGRPEAYEAWLRQASVSAADTP